MKSPEQASLWRQKTDEWVSVAGVGGGTGDGNGEESGGSGLLCDCGESPTAL